MIIQPYVMFDGRADEAFAFYAETLGAKVNFLMRFKECPDQSCMPEGTEEKVMHAELQIGESVVMASDGNCEGKPSFQGISLSILVKDLSEGERIFGALSNGGQVQMPFGKTFFSPGFGMAADKFGVSWMVVVQQ
ncbi:MAG: VOC family protein [Candidatus Hydrogenedentota bacterium]